jgi:inositol-pentakisphosphate 2-kinase
MGDGFLLAHDKTEDNALYNEALGLISYIDESQTDSQAKEEFFDLVTTLASQILVQEKILEKLQSLQRLDIIDADGAILIYERLRELCGDQADDLLDSAFSLQESTLKDNGQGSDVNKSPFKQPSDSSVLSVLLQEIESFSRKLHDCHFQVKCDEMDEALERCTRLVDSLTQNACIYLLQNWLLSLVMCDVSIFLTVQTICSSREELKKLGACSVLAPGAVKVNNNDNFRVVRRQSECSPGILLASNNRAFAYILKIVDCDRKPASKLRSRVEKEEPIRFYDNDER